MSDRELSYLVIARGYEMETSDQERQPAVEFSVGQTDFSVWEKLWKRIFGRRRGFARIPRAWSNRELRKIGMLLPGAILNCSGWCDEDKQGGYYRSYFPNATEYHISMQEMRLYEGQDPSVTWQPDVAIDLEQPISPDLQNRYDVVLCHTVLEHVFDIFTAFEVLAALSRDIVVIVTPWCQRVHEGGSVNDEYHDYWRLAPSALERLFAMNGLSLIYINGNCNWHASTYYLAVGSKRSSNHTDISCMSSARIPDGANICW